MISLYYNVFFHQAKVRIFGDSYNLSQRWWRHCTTSTCSVHTWRSSLLKHTHSGPHLSNERGFPHLIGAIDFTHVRLKEPSMNDSAFINGKNYRSINVQVICDAKLSLLNVVARWPGQVILLLFKQLCWRAAAEPNSSLSPSSRQRLYELLCSRSSHWQKALPYFAPPRMSGCRWSIMLTISLFFSSPGEFQPTQVLRHARRKPLWSKRAPLATQIFKGKLNIMSKTPYWYASLWFLVVVR